MTSAAHRRKAIELIGEASASGATLRAACGEIGISLRTLKRWRKAFLSDGDGEDRRTPRVQERCHPSHPYTRVSDDNLVEGSRQTG